MYSLRDGVFEISLTDSRAKTKNMRRDNRAVLHITDRPSWSYLSFDGTVELTPATTDVTDETSDALVAYYERVAGKPHPEWDEYRAAMVAEGRLLATLTPAGVVGQTHCPISGRISVRRYSPSAVHARFRVHGPWR